MRASPLHSQWQALGAQFAERHGRTLISRLAAAKTEYQAVRETVGLTDFSFVQKFRVPEEQGMDLLDKLVAGNVPRIRFGRVLHTLLADAQGRLIGDCYVANNDQEFIFLCESIVPDGTVQQMLAAAGGTEAGLADWTDSHVVLGLDGLRAYEVVREAFGPDVLGLPYLSVEVYPFAGETVYLFRAGKTAEFGYQVLAPAKVASELFEELHGLVQKSGGCAIGFDIHQDLRLEGRFFNIHAEGARVGDPLVLGLQWMVDWEKETFSGAEALKVRRAAGLKRKIVGFAATPGAELPAPGTALYENGAAVGEVVASCDSHVLGRPIGLAVLPVGLAYAGLRFPLGTATGALVQTISMPPIMPKSLKVKLDEV